MMRLAVIGFLFLHEALAHDCQAEDLNMELLQKHLSVETLLPKLNLLFRSTYSNDPDASAKWFARYFDGELLAYDDFATLSPEHTASVALRLSTSTVNSYKIVFARGTEIDETMDGYVQTVASDWKSKVLTHTSWSKWANLHDGLLTYALNLTAARLDGLDFVMTESAGHFYVPQTAWGLELRPIVSDEKREVFKAESEADQAYMSEHAWYEDEKSDAGDKFLSLPGNVDQSLWWRTSYLVANAESARAFAHKVLGATDIDCTGALCVDVSPDSEHGFQLRFVELTQEDEEVEAFHEFHAQKVASWTSNMTETCISASLYDNVAFEVDSLDPFIKKLDDLSVPSLVHEVSDGRYSAIFAFPGNEGIVIQLQSTVFTLRTPANLVSCSVLMR